MKKALVLIEHGFQVAEVIYPYYRLIEAGFETLLAGEQRGVSYSGKLDGYFFTADISIKDVQVDKYDVVIIPGGYAPDKMRTKPQFVRIVKEALQMNKTIGSICHGAQLLIETGLMKGRKATCYVSVKTDLINTGAEYSDEEVIVDKNLVTSRKPADLPAFMRSVLQVAGR